jgi:hypothetical protein
MSLFNQILCPLILTNHPNVQPVGVVDEKE